MSEPRVWALLSWYDEDPAHLSRCVESCAKIATHLVSIDGGYQHFPQARRLSPPAARWALEDAAEGAGLQLHAFTPQTPWMGGEVEKRAFMFEYARQCGATPDDWFLIIDGDMLVADVQGDPLAVLRQTTADTARVRWHNVRPDGHKQDDLTFRSLFRAVPGLTVMWTHYLYVQPVESGWRYLWHVPNGHESPEPQEDLTNLVTLHHRRLDRSGDRDAAGREYYKERERLKLEKPPHW